MNVNDSRPIVVTGSQRSGTTLLLLILDSHPLLVGRDETETPAGGLWSVDPPYRLALKLPAVAHEVYALLAPPHPQVVWCVRDPRDVVASMLRLKLGDIPWPAHPAGGIREVKNCCNALGLRLAPERAAVFAELTAQVRKPPLSWSRDELVRMAAAAWRFKQELLGFYDAAGLGYTTVAYEKLVRAPRETLAGLLDALGLPWNDAVLDHHRLHSGIAVGRTDRSRAIDPGSDGAWRQSLGPGDLEIIGRMCGEQARLAGYDLAA